MIIAYFILVFIWSVLTKNHHGSFMFLNSCVLISLCMHMRKVYGLLNVKQTTKKIVKWMDSNRFHLLFSLIICSCFHYSLADLGTGSGAEIAGHEHIGRYSEGLICAIDQTWKARASTVTGTQKCQICAFQRLGEDRFQGEDGRSAEKQTKRENYILGRAARGC